MQIWSMWNCECYLHFHNYMRCICAARLRWGPWGLTPQGNGPAKLNCILIRWPLWSYTSQFSIAWHGPERIITKDKDSSLNLSCRTKHIHIYIQIQKYVEFTFIRIVNCLDPKKNATCIFSICAYNSEP